MPSREDGLAGWMGKGLHGTGYYKIDPFDKDPDFKQIGAEKDGIEIIVLERFDPAKHGLVDSAVLGDVVVKPILRPGMVKRKVKATPTVYRDTYKETFHLPVTHTFSGWSKKALEAECANRRKASTLAHYASCWSVPKLMATLLENDGVHVEVIREAPSQQDNFKKEDEE
ncbi:hypothetical protein ONS95_001266 [Cadophora gregata]|uniref:uncharacterized protein n=1 Tax=Cadophora gregata TaxID=51156 RepID=UPI0026DD2D36|nr:uncharacterized protein ONS95_001266 [Cadophora gregata]KAK0129337.1 hypothetical protein ONS95_001266 [Cadophora gregata]